MEAKPVKSIVIIPASWITLDDMTASGYQIEGHKYVKHKHIVNTHSPVSLKFKASFSSLRELMC